MKYYSASQNKKKTPVPYFYGTHKKKKTSAFHDENWCDKHCGERSLGPKTTLIHIEK